MISSIGSDLTEKDWAYLQEINSFPHRNKRNHSEAYDSQAVMQFIETNKEECFKIMDEDGIFEIATG